MAIQGTIRKGLPRRSPLLSLAGVGSNPQSATGLPRSDRKGTSGGERKGRSVKGDTASAQGNDSERGDEGLSVLRRQRGDMRGG